MLRTCAAAVMILLPAALAPPLAQAQPPALTLTLDQALERARTRAPDGQSARLRVDEARGEVQGARRLGNPNLTGGLGRSLGPGGDTVEAHLELLQPLELSGGRRARIASAQAGVDAESASADATVRALEAEVALAFYRALAAREREQVARPAEEVARRVAEALDRRHQLKDVALLDVNVARGAQARADALLRSTVADRLEAEAQLKELLGIEAGQPVQLAGDLRQQRRFSLDALLARAGDRPQLRTLIAEARQAEAEAAAGRAQRWPGVAIGAAYERDEGRDIVLGLLSVELPLFDRGQGPRAVGEARARRLRYQADSGQRAALAAIQDAYAAHQQRLAAAEVLGPVVPLLDETQALARKSYEAGQLSLAEWIVVRAEAVQTRLEQVQHLLRAAEAGVALANRAGVSP